MMPDENSPAVSDQGSAQIPADDAASGGEAGATYPLEPAAFAALGIRPSILRGLVDLKFQVPSDIQSLLIPRALAGVDLLGQARTGTGKTAAFGIPILQRAVRGMATQGIILVPTRELAIQVDAEIQRIGQHTPIRCVPVYGGQKISAQMKLLKHGPEILVGTPGRVMDLLERRIINFDNIRFVVLDEVDRMLDIGFRDDIRKILGRMKGMKRARPEEDGDDSWRGGDDRRDWADEDVAQDAHEEQADSTQAQPHGKRKDRGGPRRDGSSGKIDPPLPGYPQTIFVSATIAGEIEQLARRYMREPVEKLIAPGADERPTVEKVEQYYFSVQPWDKYRLLRTLLERENPDLAIIFCRTKHGAQKLANRLHADGIQCREIHGNLAQNKRDKVMKNFRGGKFDVLVATDLASRGIDVADISHIINYDIPDDPEVYVHRVGRTARMGAAGKAFTLVSRDQGELLTKVENVINMLIPQATLEGFVPNPQPADWTDHKPGEMPTPSPAGGASRGPTGDPDSLTHPPVPLPPPRSLGAKIPLTRRHRRRR